MSIVQFALLSCACSATAVLAICSTSSDDRSFSTSAGESDPVEEPLFLTPFIDAGKLDEAKIRSRDKPLLNNIESYSGYLTVNKTSKSHLFFWYTPRTAANDSSSAPLILWLQGGPGSSSLYGLLLENGPFEMTVTGGLRRRVHAWTNNYHMLYIDQPVGTGFSFTEADGYIRTEKEVAEHLYEALRQFYLIFDKLACRDFYIAGQSYAGMYIPALAYKIHNVNQRRAHGFKLPLKGMMIGNAYSDSETQYEYGDLLWGLGMIDEHEQRQLRSIQTKIKHKVQSRQWSQIAYEDQKLFTLIENMVGMVNLYDYNEDYNDTHRKFRAAWVRFLEQDQIGKFVHVGCRRFDDNAARVVSDFEQDSAQTVRPWIEELLEHYPTLFYTGQFDIMVAHTLTQDFLASLEWSGATEYRLAKKRIWRVGKSVAGYYKAAKNLVYVVVRNAGHYVPVAQPANALTMIDLFVNKRFQSFSVETDDIYEK